MPIEVIIVDGSGKKVAASVNLAGGLATAAVEYDEVESRDLDTDDTAFNFYSPKPSEQFLIKGILVFANKDINDASDTIIVIYEASEIDSTTVDKILFRFGMGKLTVLPIMPLNIIVNSGKYVNAKTGDNSIFMTIFGHFVIES